MSGFVAQLLFFCLSVNATKIATALRVLQSPLTAVVDTYEPTAIEINDGFGDHDTFVHSEGFAALRGEVNVSGLTLFREEMRRKLMHMQNVLKLPVRFYPVCEFLKMEWVQQLPKKGVAIFAVDDPFHSCCHSIKPGSYIEDPRVLAFGVENYVGPPHPKIIQLPIGLESSLMVGRYGDLVTHFTSMAGSPVPYHERKYNLQSDAHLHIFAKPASGLSNDRQAMIDGVQRSAIDQWYRSQISFEDHLNIIANTRLALCPEGNGADCHRFYHNYAVGTRCVVKKGVLTPVHSQFPGTVVVESWADVTEANVNKWVKEDPPKRDMRLLTSSYWINKVLKVAQQQPVTEEMFSHN